jgi:hypothetical protein
VPLNFRVINFVFQMVCAESQHYSIIKTTSILAPLLGFVVERLLGNNYVILRLANSLDVFTFVYVAVPCIPLLRTTVAVSTNFVF